MNKQIIILSVTAILVLVVAGEIVYGRNQARVKVQTRSLEIGQSLIRETNSTLLVEIGSGLKSKLSEFLDSSAKVEQVSLGDEAAPIGDGSASSQLWLVNGRQERIVIRLRWDSGHDKFHVLGFWTPPDAPKEFNH